jgi:hypothetical protein
VLALDYGASLGFKVTITMFQRLKLLKRFLGVNLSPQQGMALLERIQSSTLSDQDRGLVTKIIRATVELPDKQLQEPSLPEVPLHARSNPTPQRKAKRQRQSAKASRRRHRHD